jgi:YbbR domain-containing protein
LDENNQDKVSRILKILNIKNNKDLLTFSIFLILSTIFWFLIALNKVYTTEVPFPIVYKNLPEDRILTNNPPEEIIITIRGQGFDLLKYEFTKFLFPFIIDVSKLAKNQTSGERYVFYTQDLVPDLSKKFKSEIKIVNVYPSKIYLNFNNIATKTVKVKPIIKYKLDNQYILSGKIKVIPNKITIKGAESIIDSIKYVETEFFNFRTVNKVITRRVPLKTIDKVNFSTRYVKITIPAYKYTENKIKVPVTIKNLPDTVSIKIIPQEVTIKYKVALKDFKKVKPSNFVVTADFSSLNLKESNIVKIFVSKKSRYAFDVTVYPQKVKIFVVK